MHPFGGSRPPASSRYCVNGHYAGVVDPRNPVSYKAQFCPQCGAETINKCPHCGLLFENLMPGSTTPAFCRGCGKGLPWQLRTPPASAASKT